MGVIREAARRDAPCMQVRESGDCPLRSQGVEVHWQCRSRLGGTPMNSALLCRTVHFCITLSITICALFTSVAHADTMAMQFQAQQPTDHWPDQGSQLNMLVNGVGPNAEAVWNGGNPRPPGMPPNATHAIIQRFYHTESWNTPCRGSCWEEEGGVTMSI